MSTAALSTSIVELVIISSRAAAQQGNGPWPCRVTARDSHIYVTDKHIYVLVGRTHPVRALWLRALRASDAQHIYVLLLLRLPLPEGLRPRPMPCPALATGVLVRGPSLATVLLLLMMLLHDQDDY